MVSPAGSDTLGFKHSVVNVKIVITNTVIETSNAVSSKKE